GSSHPHAGIGSAGATALDSTLPIIKQACSPEAVPTAMVSGLILTVLAPIAITTALA
ncbi:MAG: LysO family transporter, partial [Arthrobacter sp.]|nr:LysO family transporter [Arthrobacter sp.]